MFLTPLSCHHISWNVWTFNCGGINKLLDSLFSAGSYRNAKHWETGLESYATITVFCCINQTSETDRRWQTYVFKVRAVACIRTQTHASWLVWKDRLCFDVIGQFVQSPHTSPPQTLFPSSHILCLHSKCLHAIWQWRKTELSLLLCQAPMCSSSLLIMIFHCLDHQQKELLYLFAKLVWRRKITVKLQ